MVCMFVSGASLVPANVSAAETADRGGALSVELAQDRAQRVSAVAYRLSFDLQPEREDFGGRVTATFDLASTTKPLLLDFEDGSVQSVVANGNRLDDVYDGHSIALPSAALRAGRNTV